MDHTVWQDETLAKWYMEGVRGAIPLAEEQFDVMLRLIDAAGIPVRRFLDLGCGAGALGAVIVERYPDATGDFVDFSESMLESARTALGGPGSRHRFVFADYAEEDWAQTHGVAGPFDAIVSGFSIHHQPDEGKRAIFQLCYEWLSPGGMFINLEHVESATAWGSKIFDERFIDALHQHELKGGGSRSRKEVADTYYYRDDKEANILAPVEAQCGWLREIGFKDVDCFFKHYEIALFGGRKG